MSAPTSVFIVEDHALLAEALVLTLRLQGFEPVEATPPDDTSPATVLASAAALGPDVVLLDLHLHDGRLGIPLIEPLVAGGATVLMLTGSQDRELLARCLEAGAAGLFDKGLAFDHLVALIRDAAMGVTVLKPWAREELLLELRNRRSARNRQMAPFEALTAREQVVLAAISDGRSAEEIASSLHVSVATVRSHIRAVLRKLGVNSQLAAVAIARRSGWPLDTT